MREDSEEGGSSQEGTSIYHLLMGQIGFTSEDLCRLVGFLTCQDWRHSCGGLTVVAANAGGAWSPIGDVTTTMLWIRHKISTTGGGMGKG